MNTGLKVMDAMTKEAVTVSSGTSAFECAKIMKKESVGNVIVAEKGKILGIITEQDLIYRVAAENKNPKGTLARDIMTKEVLTISPDSDITDAMLKMTELDVRRFPVVEDGVLLGILTLKDILRVEPQLFELIIEKIELREEESKPIKRMGSKEGLCQSCGSYTPFLFEQDEILVCKDCRY